jgi:glycosyltransferase involved in cell wall biosynthesis
MKSEKYLPGRMQTKSDGPLVSVVTPFFNTAEYLEECIQSVLDQTYENFEYILADNCSTDGSAQIAEKYAASDPRIRLFREVDFLGQVENYNRALTYLLPESRYCKIVQADDWIYPRCLEEMVSVAESGENVGLVSSFSLYGNSPSQGGLPMSQGPVFTGHDAVKAKLLGKDIFGSPTCVMYLSDIVRSRRPFFSTSMRYFEDTEVCFDILRDHNFGFVPQILTFTRRDNESVWSGIGQYSPYLLHEFIFIRLYGQEFLNAEELAQRTCEVEDTFYYLLGNGLLHRYSKEFWQFHKNGLASVGLTISYRKLVLRALSIVMDTILNPKQTVETLWRRANRSRP